MKTHKGKDAIIGTYISGLTYTGIVAIILIILGFAINDEWWSSPITYIIILTLCFLFFVSGLRRIKGENIGFLSILGERRKDEYYFEGLWWIFPLWSLEQKLHFDNFYHEGEDLNKEFITIDGIPINIQVQYYWRPINIEDIDYKYSPSYVNKKLNHELGIFVRSKNAIELLTDVEISKKVLENYLNDVAQSMRITFTDVFPNFNYSQQYVPIVQEYARKYEELKFRIKKLQLEKGRKEIDYELFTNQIKSLVNELHLSNDEAINCMKILKNDIVTNEHSFNFNNTREILIGFESIIKTLTNPR